MAQRKPDDKITVDEVLKLVQKLTPEEREELLHQLKLEDLRRQIQEGIDSADRGELYSEEEVMAYLEKHHKQRVEKEKK